MSKVGQYFTDMQEVLTPPTQEDVCQALIEYLECIVFYDNDSKEFIATLIKPVVYQYSVTKQIRGHYCIPELNYLPPHLITLIGRFYEGLESEK